MCTTDEFQGFRKLRHFPTVSLSSKFDEGKVYDAPEGWHWATRAEVEAAPGWERKEGARYYCRQGGWKNFTWEGVEREGFRFRLDSGGRAVDTTACIHAGGYEGQVHRSTHQGFAGIVCMPD